MLPVGAQPPCAISFGIGVGLMAITRAVSARGLASYSTACVFGRRSAALCAMSFGADVGLNACLPRRIGQTCDHLVEAGLASRSTACVFGRRSAAPCAISFGIGVALMAITRAVSARGLASYNEPSRLNSSAEP